MRDPRFLTSSSQALFPCWRGNRDVRYGSLGFCADSWLAQQHKEGGTPWGCVLLVTSLGLLARPGPRDSSAPDVKFRELTRWLYVECLLCVGPSGRCDP